MSDADATALDRLQLELIQVGAVVAAVTAREISGGDEEAGEERVGSLERIPLAALDSTLPLGYLAERAGLDEAATTVLRILVAGELDRSVHLLLRRLASDPTRPGIEVGSAVAVASSVGVGAQAALGAFDPAALLVSGGLVLLGGEGPLLTRRSSVSPRVLAYAQGRFEAPGQVASALAGYDEPPLLVEPARPARELELAPAEVERLRKLLPLVVRGEVVWISGPAGSGKRTLLAALCRESGLRLLTVNYRALVRRRPGELVAALRRETLLCEAVLCVHGAVADMSDPPRALADLVELLHRAKLPVVYASEELPPAGDLEEPVHGLELAIANGPTRLAVWKAALPELEQLDELASRFRLTPGRIVRAAVGARSLAEMQGRTLTLDDVHRAVSLQVSQKVSVLGTRIEDRQTWNDVVLPPDTLDAVREIVSRARHRHKVLQDWGFHRKLAKGVGLAALFAGPPGTGKTMVAGLIARELELELYQIDLSRIVSKYIGETEKNLAQVFDAAEGANVLLLFDEADSLFAKRTEVKSSIDRYSNLEVNYLLQRLERFEGVSILTTNLEGSIDPAFKRRLAFRVNFPMPDADEREKLWRRMLPVEAEVEGPLVFEQLAAKYEFSGGNIRNAMLRAAFLAAGDGRGLAMAHIERAVVLEYRDTGKLFASGRLG